MTAPSERAIAREVERRKHGPQLLCLARSVLLFIGALPWWLPVARRSIPLGVVGTIIDGVFISVCHRIPERTLWIANVAQPVCSRCAGLYGGLALGALIAWPRPAMKQSRLAVLFAGLLLLIDVVLQDLQIHPLWHSSRLITGVLLGYALAMSLLSAIHRARF